ncbi:MAG: autotransporter-associated beta strand repeat-containing protein [Kiritimatiellia bacterium]
MKTATLTMTLLAAMVASADEILKAENFDDLDLASSWVGGGVPGPLDYMVWHPFTETQKVHLRNDLAVYGAILTNNSNVASIELGQSGDAGTLTLGAGGYYVRNGSKTVTIYAKTKLACDQLWTNAGGTLVFGGDVDLNGKNLTVDGAVEMKGSANAHDGSVIQKSGSYKMSSGTYSSNVDFILQRNAGLQFNQEPAKGGNARARNVTLEGTGHYDGATLYAIGRKENDGNEVVSGVLTVTNGLGSVRLVPNGTRHMTMEVGSLAHSVDSTIWFRGTNLGLSPMADLEPNYATLKFQTAPTVIGGAGAAGTPSVSIIPYAVCATNDDYGVSFATYDATYGVRPLDLDAEYVPELTSGSVGNDNVRLVNSTSGEVVTTRLAAGTTEINALMLDTPNNVQGNGGVVITGPSDAVLKVKSGTVYARQMMSGVTAADALRIEGVSLDFAGKGGQIISRQTQQNNMTSNAPLQLDCNITNDGGEGVTFSSVANRGLIYLQGSAESTYTGPTRLINGNLRMVKAKDSSGKVIPAIPGDLYVYGGSCQNTGSQIKETASVYVYGGNYLQKGGASNSGSGASQTFKDLFITGNGAVTSGASGSSAGATTMNDGTMLGGTWTICRGHTVNLHHLTLAGGTMNVNKFESPSRKTQLKISDGLTISNTIASAYRPMSFEQSSSAQYLGSSLFLAGGLKFIGNDSNTNRVEIFNAEPVAEGAEKAHLYMAETQTFDIGDGAADVDFYLNLDGADETTGVPAGILKSGAGTLMLASDNTYTGGTKVEAGRLIVDGSLASGVTVSAGATFRGGAAEESGALAVTGDVTLASGAKLEVEPGATMTVSGTLALAGTEMTLKPGATIEEEFLVARAAAITGAPTSNLGKFKAKVRNGGTELWIGRDNSFLVVVR